MLLFLLSNSIILPFFPSPLFLMLSVPQSVCLSWPASFAALPFLPSFFPFALYHNLHSSFIHSGDASVARSLVLQLRVVAPDLGLELDELFGDFVVGPLGQYSQDGESRLVHVDAAAECQPTRARALQKKRFTLKGRHGGTAKPWPRILKGEERAVSSFYVRGRDYFVRRIFRVPFWAHGFIRGIRGI